MTETVLGYLLATGALLLFSTAILATKAASSRIELGLGFVIATSTNVAFAALALLLQLLWRGTGIEWNWPAFGLFVVAGVCSTWLGRFFFYESVVRFGPSRASIFQISSPLFTALIAWLTLGERLTLPHLFGMLVTVAGLMLVSLKPGQPIVSAAAAPELVRLSLGQRFLQSILLLGLGSSLAYATGNVLRGTAVRSWNEPVLGALVGAVAGLLLYLVFQSGRRGLAGRLRSADRRGVRLYALIGVVTISAQICAIGAMRYIPLAVANLVTLCTPLLIFPLSRWLFGNTEKVTALTLAGGLLTLLGIALIVLR
jgi:drug/metabolite transporter (DMT)-like permease